MIQCFASIVSILSPYLSRAQNSCEMSKKLSMSNFKFLCNFYMDFNATKKEQNLFKNTLLVMYIIYLWLTLLVNYR